MIMLYVAHVCMISFFLLKLPFLYSYISGLLRKFSVDVQMVSVVCSKLQFAHKRIIFTQRICF